MQIASGMLGASAKTAITINGISNELMLRDVKEPPIIILSNTNTMPTMPHISGNATGIKAIIAIRRGFVEMKFSIVLMTKNRDIISHSTHPHKRGLWVDPAKNMFSSRAMI